MAPGRRAGPRPCGADSLTCRGGPSGGSRRARPGPIPRASGRLGWLGVAAIVAGGALLAGGGGWPGVQTALLVALAYTCWGLDNHLTALIDGITSARSTLVKGLVAGGTNLAIGLSLAPIAASPGALAAALVVGVLSYGASIALYIASAHEIGATRAQGVFATAPFVGAVLAFTLLGERFGPEHAGACILLAAAVPALLWSQHTHEHVHEPTQYIHSHRHDDGHHFHEHPGLSPSTRHSHAHIHDRLVHAHPTGRTSTTATRTGRPRRADSVASDTAKRRKISVR